MGKSPGIEARLFSKGELFAKKALPKTIERFGIILLSLAIFQGACAGQKKAKIQIDRTHRQSGQLFPNGTYLHQVKIIPKGARVRKIKVAVLIAPDTLRLVGLSPLNTTLFNIVEKRPGGEVSMNFYGPVPEKIQKEFEPFYQTLRHLLLFSLGDPREHQAQGFVVRFDSMGYPLWVKSEAGGTQINLDDYDAKGIPLKLTATHPLFKASVRISGYELAEGENDS